MKLCVTGRCMLCYIITPLERFLNLPAGIWTCSDFGNIKALPVFPIHSNGVGWSWDHIFSSQNWKSKKHTNKKPLCALLFMQLQNPFKKWQPHQKLSLLKEVLSGFKTQRWTHRFKQNNTHTHSHPCLRILAAADGHWRHKVGTASDSVRCE